MGVNRKPIIINATVIFTSAAIFLSLLYQVSRYIAAFLLGVKPLVLFHNSLSYPTIGLSDKRLVFIALSGPLVSLFAGFFCHFLCLEQQNRSLGFLFKLFLSGLGYTVFFGYLIISPFFSAGNKEIVTSILGFPLPITAILSVLCASSLFLIIRNLMQFFVEMGTTAIADSRLLRAKLISSVLLFPVLLGVLFTTLLSFPVQTSLGLLAPVLAPLALLCAYNTVLLKRYPFDMMNRDMTVLETISIRWIIVFGLLIVINRILVFGI